MALTEQDKLECREIGREIVKEVLAEHISTCPHHQSYLLDKSKLWGIIFGVAVASGGATGVVGMILKALM